LGPAQALVTNAITSAPLATAFNKLCLSVSFMITETSGPIIDSYYYLICLIIGKLLFLFSSKKKFRG
jgi:hypothetical protein